MWVSRKTYKFLKENAEKNINAECQVLTAKENQRLAIARAVEEYSEVLKERDELRLEVIELKNRLTPLVTIASWTLNLDGSGICGNCGRIQKNVWDHDNYQNYCGHCGAEMRV